MAAPPTQTAQAQADLDRALAAAAALAAGRSTPNPLRLDREAHVAFARRALKTLPSGYSSLGASRPWVLHWATHSLALLGAPLSADPEETVALRAAIVTFLRACQSRDKGGFGGGPGQEPHLATTYAAAATLVTLGGEEALVACDRSKLASFLLSCIVKRKKNGEEKEGEEEETTGYGFRVCPGGESDVRGCYCALAASALLRLPAPADPRSLAERAGLFSYLRDCQTAEGGVGGFPGGPEAHGGYAFCAAAAAALALLADGGGGGGGGGDARSPLPSSSSSSSSSSFPLDARALLLWASRCQSATGGGFAGRTNKLVDGCYSWWQGALFGMVPAGAVAAPASSSLSFPPFDASKLPALPGLPPLPEGVAKAPTATERIEEEVRRGAGGESAAAARLAAAAAAAALEEARAASRLRELLPEAPRSLYDPLGLQMWILAYCQEPSTEISSPPPDANDGDRDETQQQRRLRRREQQQRKRLRGGGLRDKPGKPPDHYHTCYCLSGLSAAQQAAQEAGGKDAAVVVGGEDNRLQRTHSLLNVVEAKVREASAFFSPSSLEREVRREHV